MFNSSVSGVTCAHVAIATEVYVLPNMFCINRNIATTLTQQQIAAAVLSVSAVCLFQYVCCNLLLSICLKS